MELFVKRFAFVVLASLSIALLTPGCAHPQCLDFFAPFDHDPQRGPVFCATYKEFGCCTANTDQKISGEFERIAAVYESMDDASTEGCLGYLKDILCQVCSPYAAHVYDAEATHQRTRQLPGLCHSYCWEFHRTCSSLLSLITSENTLLEASSNSTAKFCREMALADVDYCFPDVLINDDLSQWVEEAQAGTGRSECLCVEEFANGLRNPLLFIHAGDNTHRLFIGEQIGVIHVFLENRTRLQEPFLDIRDSVLTSNRRADERGLLGGAFHPNFTKNSRFFLYYSTGTSTKQLVRISEFKLMDDNMNKINISSEKVILEVDEPYASHNGGQLMFGMDGYLYASIGDGGAVGDPHNNALNKNSILGKMIRIDVDNPCAEGRNYGIPTDNPFVGYNETARPEIYAFGFRNAWRCSLDRGDQKTGYGKGRIFCGDVGQNRFEEVDLVVKGGNYGWRAREGYTCYKNKQCKDKWLADEILPIHVYSHDVGKSITGGYVYRGCQSPNLNGKYIFGDFETGRIFTLTENNETGAWDSQEICMGEPSICSGNLVNTYQMKIMSFGEDEAGEVYILTTGQPRITNRQGKIFKIVDPGRRGNPSECRGEKKAVEINGPTIPFVPTTTRRHYPLDCAEQNQNRGFITSETVCAPDFVFSGQVITSRRFRKEWRVRLQVLGVDRRLKHVPEILGEITLTVPCMRHQCRCPNLKTGRSYHLSGKYQKRWLWNRYVVDTNSFWPDWNETVALRVKQYSSECETD